MAELLFLAHRLPYPPNKGDKVRSWHLLKHLAAQHRLHLGTFVDDPDDLKHLPRLREVCASVHYSRLHPRRGMGIGLLGPLGGAGGPLTRGPGRGGRRPFGDLGWRDLGTGRGGGRRTGATGRALRLGRQGLRPRRQGLNGGCGLLSKGRKGRPLVTGAQRQGPGHGQVHGPFEMGRGHPATEGAGGRAAIHEPGPATEARTAQAQGEVLHGRGRRDRISSGV